MCGGMVCFVMYVMILEYGCLLLVFGMKCYKESNEIIWFNLSRLINRVNIELFICWWGECVFVFDSKLIYIRYVLDLF